MVQIPLHDARCVVLRDMKNHIRLLFYQHFLAVDDVDAFGWVADTASGEVEDVG